MSSDPITSHGRGGAGNIERDEKAYADGEIVREGPLGDQGDGAYSSGRGGVGNMESPHIKPHQGGSGAGPGDTDVVPETAMRPAKAEYENFHTGRGGGGNVHRDHPEEHEHEGLKEKAKHLFGGGKKEGE